METLLSEVCFAVVDVETTGLEDSDRVIEVACVKLQAFREVARFSSLVDPARAIPPSASAISGIDAALLAGAPRFAEIAAALAELLSGAVLVAHNAPFDLHFLSAEFRRCGHPPWRGAVVDTLRLARNVVTLPGYSLAELRESLQLAPAPAHRALADVLTTVALLRNLIARLDPPPRTLSDLLRAQEPVAIAWQDLPACGLSSTIRSALAAAGEAEQPVEILYAGRAGVRPYRIVPLGLERNGPLVYLQARLAPSGEPRTFRADRITAIRNPAAPAEGEA